METSEPQPSKNRLTTISTALPYSRKQMDDPNSHVRRSKVDKWGKWMGTGNGKR